VAGRAPGLLCLWSRPSASLSVCMCSVCVCVMPTWCRGWSLATGHWWLLAVGVWLVEVRRMLLCSAGLRERADQLLCMCCCFLREYLTMCGMSLGTGL
jgi:hypothetical protein